MIDNTDAEQIAQIAQLNSWVAGLLRERAALVKALKNARNCIDTLIINSPDKKKRRNLGEFIREIDDALGSIKETV